MSPKGEWPGRKLSQAHCLPGATSAERISTRDTNMGSSLSGLYDPRGTQLHALLRHNEYYGWTLSIISELYAQLISNQGVGRSQTITRLV